MTSIDNIDNISCHHHNIFIDGKNNVIMLTTAQLMAHHHYNFTIRANNSAGYATSHITISKKDNYY